MARPRLRRRSTSLITRIQLASFVLALLVAGSFAVLVLAMSTLRASNERVTRSKDITRSTLLLEKLVVDLETGLRGFVLTGNGRMLEPWRSASAAMPYAVKHLELLVADDPVQERRVHKLVQPIKAYLRDYSIPLVKIARISPSAARLPIATVEGKRRTDAIRDRFRDFLATEDAVASQRSASAEARSSRALGFGIGALATSGLLILLFGLYLARRIARPVRNVAEGATRLADGDLSTRLQEEGLGEIYELTRAFNSMAVALEQGKLELEEQNEELRASERLKSELVKIVAHELRTPLASVLGYTSLLLKRDFQPEQRTQYLEIIGTEAKRLASLVEDFLDADRAQEGGIELEERVFDIAALVREQVRISSGQSVKHKLSLALQQSELTVNGDSARIAQVIANLLGNAIKYSPEGGPVEVVAEARNGVARVSVRDCGMGIPAEHQSRIFTKFYRGEARESGIAGTGLGLAIAREIVEAHGGHIGFMSAQGDGSVFWFELPLAQVQLGEQMHAAAVSA